MNGGVRKRLLSGNQVDDGDTPSDCKPTKKKCGGIRQRLELDKPQAASSSKTRDESIKTRLHSSIASGPAIPSGPLNNKLIDKWATGKNKSNEVYEFGNAASAQGAQNMGKLSRETSTKNAQRDLLKAVGLPDEAPEIDFIDIPGVQNQAICCPIKYFESLVCGDESRFKTVLCGKPKANVEFWDQLHGHPTCPEDVDANTLALGIHGDGAAISNTQGLFTISWNSLHPKGVQTQENRNIYACIRKSQIVPGTLEKIFDRLAWSLNAISEGKLPERDWKGKPLKNAGRILAKGWKGKLIQVRGDWEFYCQALQFPTSTSVPRMCWICQASPEGRLKWSNCTDNADWRLTLESHATYLARLIAEGKELPSLFKILTLKLEGVMIDVLHTVDQGVASHLIANVLCEICDLLPGGTQAQRAEVLNKKLKKWYKDHPDCTRLDGELTWTTLKSSGDWPRLRAKAACTRHMIGFATKLAAEHNSGSDHDEKRLACCELLQRFYNILKQEPEFLSTSAKAALRKTGNIFVQIYVQLAEEALTQNLRMWKMSPKFHLFIHLCELCWINPRFAWTYADEDLMKHMKWIAKSLHPSTVSHICLHKWLVSAFAIR